VTNNQLKQIISDCWNEVVFTYNGKQSGVTSEVENSIPTFQVWHGQKIKYYSDVDELMEDKFYSGKPLNELVGEIEIQVL